MKRSRANTSRRRWGMTASAGALALGVGRWLGASERPAQERPGLGTGPPRRGAGDVRGAGRAGERRARLPSLTGGRVRGALHLGNVRPGRRAGVWFVLAPFTGSWSGLAHTFVSFELAGGRFLAISVEARRERGEDYFIWGGLMRPLEMTYVVGTESDLLGVRALRGDVLYLYPSKASPDQARAMLVDMLRRAQRFQTEPEFYNSVWNNCATNLRAHVNRVVEEPLPFGWGILFPGYSDKLALERGLLATNLPL